MEVWRSIKQICVRYIISTFELYIFVAVRNMWKFFVLNSLKKKKGDRTRDCSGNLFSSRTEQCRVSQILQTKSWITTDFSLKISSFNKLFNIFFP